MQVLQDIRKCVKNYIQQCWEGTNIEIDVKYKQSQWNKYALTAPPVELIFPFSHSKFHHWERG